MKLKAITGLTALIVLSATAMAQTSDEKLPNIKVQKSWYGEGGKHATAYIMASINEDPAVWTFYCLREDTPENDPCTILQPGTYPGMFFHNCTLLGVLVKDNSNKESPRYFNVRPEASPQLVKKYASYTLSYPGLKAKRESEYPMVLHIYGAISERYPIGTLPGSATCTEGYGPDLINCTSSPPRNIEQEFNGFLASLDGSFDWLISCTAKWAASNCRALRPALYLARWKDSKKTQLRVLMIDQKNKEWEITLDAVPYRTAQTEVARPPDQ